MRCTVKLPYLKMPDWLRSECSKATKHCLQMDCCTNCCTNCVCQCHKRTSRKLRMDAAGQSANCLVLAVSYLMFFFEG